ncbi:hypothetical protein TNCV_4463281 [Trichonephila clavipes]|nr:hypothetical protein TNCV_4463281 [Trichonephila clavipes]
MVDHVKYVETQSSPIGEEWKLETGGTAQVSSSSLGYNSKLRGPSPIAIMMLQSTSKEKRRKNREIGLVGSVWSRDFTLLHQ